MTNFGKTKSAQWILPVLILLAAFALRLYHLGDKGLWGDEIAQARWALFPLDKMWERFREPPDFIFHFLLGNVALQIGADAFWARLPSLLTAFLVVPAAYVAARRLTSRWVALGAMLLAALSPFQIWYAQDARMYASLALFSVLSLYFFVRLLDQPQWRSVIGLTLANALAVYTHLFGVMPIVIETIALVGLILAKAAHRDFSAKRAWLLIVTSFILTALLALPLLPGTLPYVLNPSLKGLEAAFGENPFQLSPAFLQLLLSDIGFAPDMGWRTALSLVLALAGWMALARVNARGAWICAAWLIAPLAILQITQPGHTVANRYLIFLQPVYLVLIANGLGVMLRGANVVLMRAAAWRNLNLNARVWVGAGAVVVFILLLSVAPLRALYARAKLNDWQTLARFFETHTTPGDVLMVEKDFWGMNTLAYYLQNVNAFSSPPATMAELQNALAQNRTMWYMSFGGYLNPEQEAWVKQNLQRVDDAAWMRADLDYVPRDEFHFTQSEPLIVLYTRAGKIPSEIVYANELGDRARETPFVPIRPGGELRAQLASEGGGARVLEIEYTSKDPARFEVLVNGALLANVRDDAPKTKSARVRLALRANLPEAILIQVKNTETPSLLQIRALRLRRE